VIIPSIDLMGGKAVQLQQGKKRVLEREDVIGLAKKFRLYGEIAVIDLDCALGKGSNIELVKELCRIADCRVGGGIRTQEKAEELLRAGARKIIIGTKATSEFLKQFPRDRVIVAIDSKGGHVTDKGWTRKTKKGPLKLLKELEPYCCGFLYTDVDREGLMKGIDLKFIGELKSATKNELTAAGGIRSIDEIKALEQMNVSCQLGMSIYIGAIELTDAFMYVLDWKKNNNLIPTIVQDESGRVLMMAYSSEASLRKMFETGSGTYYSRSRKALWTKGETSGHTQEVLKVRFDCDRDTLLVTVRQKNAACHTGSYSCFGDKGFTLDDLYCVIKYRVENPVAGSYTSKVSAKEESIKAKIAEECQEVLEYRDRENLVWELADLTYFTMVLMAKKGITPDEVRSELWRRRK